MPLTPKLLGWFEFAPAVSYDVKRVLVATRARGSRGLYPVERDLTERGVITLGALR